MPLQAPLIYILGGETQVGLQRGTQPGFASLEYPLSTPGAPREHPRECGVSTPGVLREYPVSTREYP